MRPSFYTFTQISFNLSNKPSHNPQFQATINNSNSKQIMLISRSTSWSWTWWHTEWIRWVLRPRPSCTWLRLWCIRVSRGFGKRLWGSKLCPCWTRMTGIGWGSFFWPNSWSNRNWFERLRRIAWRTFLSIIFCLSYFYKLYVNSFFVFIILQSIYRSILRFFDKKIKKMDIPKIGEYQITLNL